MLLGAGGAVSFLKDRFDSVLASKGCTTTTNVAITELDLENLGRVGTVILGEVSALFGAAFEKYQG